MTRPSTSLLHTWKKGVDARDKPGHDVENGSCSGRNHQIDRLGAFALLVRFDLECDALSFGQILQPRPFHRGDVNEHIAAAVIGFDEAIAAFSVEELDRPSHGHRENSYPVLLRRYARRVPARPDIRCLKAWPSGRIKRPRRSAFEICEALSLRRYHSRKRNVKPVLMALIIIRFSANCLRTFRGVHRHARLGLRASQGLGNLGSCGLGVSSLNRPAPPWPSGFSSSGRMAFSSPASVHGGLTISRPAEFRPAPDG